MVAQNPPKKHLIIATRGSALALWQADYVTSLLKTHGVSAEKLIIKTTGDRVQDRFLHEIGGKGLFVREIEQALQDGKADLAIHSLKDMPAKIISAFTLAAILKRHKHDDLLILRNTFRPELSLPSSIRPEFFNHLDQATIGTGSLRRQSILSKFAPNIKTVGIRGNVDTRIRKLQEGEWDGIILAHASIERLAITGLRSAPLATDWFIPSPSQGALAIECRAGDPVAEWLKILNCAETESAVMVERGVLASLGGDCTMPFACIVEPLNGAISGHAAVYGKDGVVAETLHKTPSLHNNIENFSNTLVQGLLSAGAEKVLWSLGISLPK